MTINKQQTAVDILFDRIKLKADSISCNTEKNRMVKGAYVDCLMLIQQAKEMEKEKMIEFAKQSLDKALDLDVRTAYSQVEKYYNKTYGGNK